MATSPPAFSPPQTHVSLPTKRPSLALPPNSNPSKRRKQSLASTASAHPLRQTSFPPADARLGSRQPVYSPSAPSVDDDLDVDDEIQSTVGSSVAGPASTLDGRSTVRGRGGKRGRGKGRPARSVTGGPAKSVDGDTSTIVSGRGRKGASTVNGGAGDDAAGSDSGDEEEDDNGFETAVAGQGGAKLTRQALEKQKQERAAFLDALPAKHLARYDLWNRIALKREVVRRLVNQTLSQSVPSNVVMTVNAYTKVFAGEIVDRARQVQREWVAAAEALPMGEKNVQGMGESETEVKEYDLGPLLPDHLREALRRYKHDRDGGTVGFTGISLEGREAAAVRSGGRRLFK